VERDAEDYRLLWLRVLRRKRGQSSRAITIRPERMLGGWWHRYQEGNGHNKSYQTLPGPLFIT